MARLSNLKDFINCFAVSFSNFFGLSWVLKEELLPAIPGFATFHRRSWRLSGEDVVTIPDAGAKVLPARPSNTSFVYDWGVRVISTSKASATAVWMCLASETCRTQRAKMLMSSGQTSKATHNFSKAHGIGSDKTASEVGRLTFCSMCWREASMRRSMS
ncbi:hypothetical protein GN958_ATG21875 [Phytophthora infestans]|uniref:Uncharacterized protein n=1 Tax=Phytophthora infestans TaxID=4787 RepID=A0A8S9TPR6_PHYIN|nr:hypothetical protein GN958_ATG21875 [Phytophthora infestans]